MSRERLEHCKKDNYKKLYNNYTKLQITANQRKNRNRKDQRNRGKPRKPPETKQAQRTKETEETKNQRTRKTINPQATFEHSDQFGMYFGISFIDS